MEIYIIAKHELKQDSIKDFERIREETRKLMFKIIKKRRNKKRVLLKERISDLKKTRFRRETKLILKDVWHPFPQHFLDSCPEETHRTLNHISSGSGHVEYSCVPINQF